MGCGCIRIHRANLLRKPSALAQKGGFRRTLGTPLDPPLMQFHCVSNNTIPSKVHLQRHSRDVLNQALPPIFMRTVRRSFNKLCARRRERLGTRLSYTYYMHSGGSRILKRGVPLIWAAGVYVYIGQTCCVNLQHLHKKGGSAEP